MKSRKAAEKLSRFRVALRRKRSRAPFCRDEKAFGRLDVLVNNAAVYKFELLEEITEQEFHREFNTNVLGLILATQEALKYFGKDGGSVINISSLATSPHATGDGCL